LRVVPFPLSEKTKKEKKLSLNFDLDYSNTKWWNQQPNHFKATFYFEHYYGKKKITFNKYFNCWLLGQK